MRKKIILRHRNFNKQKTGQAKRAVICRQTETGQAKRAVILVGILALGLILLAGCRQRPKEVELEKKELIPLEEMVPLEPMAEKAPLVTEAPPAVAPTTVAPATVTGKIDINTATQAQLETLPRIGPVTAVAIFAGRPYSRIEDLDNVPRIGLKTIENLRPYITVGGAAAPAAVSTVAPAVTPTVAPAMAPAVVAGKINVNTATQAQLETISGVGPVTAKAIIAGRPYSRIEDLDRVPRIGLKTIENLRPYITVK